MSIVKRLGFGLLLVAVSLGCGVLIYFVQAWYQDSKEPEKTVVTQTPPVITEPPIAEPEPTPEPVIEEFVITTDTVNLRQGPGTDTEVAAKVPKDTVLKVVLRDVEWTSVIYEEQTVYVKNEFIEVHIPEPAPEAVPEGEIVPETAAE